MEHGAGGVQGLEIVLDRQGLENVLGVAHARRLLHRAPRLQERGQGGRHAVERAAALLLAVLGLLDALPVAQHGGWIVRHRVAEYMRVAVDELVRDGVGDVVEGELPLLLGHHGLEHHLQEHVAQFLDVVVDVLRAVHRRQQLVRLLEDAGLERFQGLDAVPRAALFGVPQARHDFMQPFDSVHGAYYTTLLPRMPSCEIVIVSGWRLPCLDGKQAWRQESPCRCRRQPPPKAV